MKLYGKQNLSVGQPKLLQEVTLVVTREEVLNLVSFFSACASEMKSNGDWDHAHLRDFLGKESALSDIVLLSDRTGVSV